jgi:hypothetical protein
VGKRFACKPDLKAYTDFLQPEQYASWIEDTVAVMRAQGLGDLLNPTYVPEPHERDVFQDKQAFTYMMLMKKVKTPTGKRIVKNYKTTYDAQAVLYELVTEGMQSTYAVLRGRELLRTLTNQKFDPRNGKVSAMEFITRFENMVEQYNEQQEHLGSKLSDELQKNLLASSVSGVTILRAVSDREQESVVRGGFPFDYKAYSIVLKAQAVLFDEQLMGRRSVNIATLEHHPADDQEQAAVDEINEFMVNVMRRRSSGATMNKETWESLSPEGKATWDKLDPGDKRKVLQYAMQRADKASIDANVTEIDGDDDVEPTVDPDEDVVAGPITEAEINSAISQARKNAHAGDARRMMSGKGKPKPKGTTLVKNVNFLGNSDTVGATTDELEEALEHYWNPRESVHPMDGADFQTGG